MDAIDLTGIELLDARSGEHLDLTAEPGPTLLMLIRHRF
jgi:hypothetical protein